VGAKGAVQKPGAKRGQAAGDQAAVIGGQIALGAPGGDLRRETIGEGASCQPAVAPERQAVGGKGQAGLHHRLRQERMAQVRDRRLRRGGAEARPVDEALDLEAAGGPQARAVGQPGMGRGRRRERREPAVRPGRRGRRRFASAAAQDRPDRSPLPARGRDEGGRQDGGEPAPPPKVVEHRRAEGLEEDRVAALAGEQNLGAARAQMGGGDGVVERVHGVETGPRLGRQGLEIGRRQRRVRSGQTVEGDVQGPGQTLREHTLVGFRVGAIGVHPGADRPAGRDHAACDDAGIEPAGRLDRQRPVVGRQGGDGLIHAPPKPVAGGSDAQAARPIEEIRRSPDRPGGEVGFKVEDGPGGEAVQTGQEIEIPGPRGGVKHGVHGRRIDRQGRPGRLEHPGRRDGGDHHGVGPAPHQTVHGAGGVAHHGVRASRRVASHGEVSAPQAINHILRRPRRGAGQAVGMGEGVAQEDPVPPAGDGGRGSGIGRKPQGVGQVGQDVAVPGRAATKPAERVGGLCRRGPGGDEGEAQHQTTRIGV